MEYILSYIESYPIIEIKNFLSHTECDQLLISRIQHFEKANSHYPEYYRNNDRYVEDTPELANQLFLKLEKYNQNSHFSEMTALNERIRFCRYQQGQSFSTHQDGVYYPNEFQASKYTFLVYLNEDFKGGMTEFFTSKIDTISIKNIQPKKGTLIIFDHRIWHKGSIIIDGNKYILRSDIIVPNLTENTHHQGYIWDLTQLDTSTFISCGRDRYIKIWDTNVTLQKAFKVHDKSVIKVLPLDKNHFISCSRDFTLKKWNTKGEVLGSVRFREMILSLHIYSKETIIAAGTSGTLYMISNEFTILNVIKVHANWIWDLVVLPDQRIISCCEDGTICITHWESKVSTCIYTHTTSLFCMYYDKAILYVGTKDGKVWQMNLVSQKTEEYQIHQDGIRAIKIHNGALITCGEDNRVMSTDFNSKKSKEHIIATNFIQDILIIRNTIYAAGYDGIIHKIKYSLKRSITEIKKNKYYENIKH